MLFATPMSIRVLVTRAGSGAATNLISGLRQGVPEGVFVVGCHDNPFVLKKSTADSNYLVLPTDHDMYARSLSDVIRRERADVVIPVTDADVMALSRCRKEVGSRVFLPEARTLALCADKLRMARQLQRRKVPVPASHPVSDLDSIAGIFRRFPRGVPAWCRARRGAGSLAAAPVSNARQARAWIRLWSEGRGVRPDAFMIAEYLPGRDFAGQSLWHRGRVILIKTTERLAYVDGAARLSGTSSVAALHKTVHDDRLVKVIVAAVQAVDTQATGAFCVDLKEDAQGQPCVTEINAGRLLSGTTIFDTAGRHSMSATYLKLATGGIVEVSETYDCPEGYYVSRDLDTVPHVFNAADFWSGWLDARPGWS